MNHMERLRLLEKEDGMLPTTKDENPRYTLSFAFLLSLKKTNLILKSNVILSSLPFFPLKLLGFACLGDFHMSGGQVPEGDFQSFTVLFSLDSPFTTTLFIVFNTTASKDTSCKNI